MEHSETHEPRTFNLMTGLSRVKDGDVLALFEALNSVLKLCQVIEIEAASIPSNVQERARYLRMDIMTIKGEVDSEVFDRLQDYRNEIERLKR